MKKSKENRILRYIYILWTLHTYMYMCHILCNHNKQDWCHTFVHSVQGKWGICSIILYILTRGMHKRKNKLRMLKCQTKFVTIETKEKSNKESIVFYGVRLFSLFFSIVWYRKKNEILNTTTEKH